MTKGEANRRRRKSAAKQNRNPDGTFINHQLPIPCICCGNMFKPTQRQKAMICQLCMSVAQGRAALRKFWAEKREALFLSTLGVGAESLPDEDSFSPLSGEAIVLKMMRGEW